MSGVLSGPLSHFGECTVQSHIIVFTDGSSESLLPENDPRVVIPPSPDIEELAKQAMISGVIDTIDNHAIKIYYVPVGKNEHNSVLEQAVRETNGKIVPVKEMYRLIRKTQVIILASQIASDIRFTDDTSHDTIKRKIREDSRCDDSKKDCFDMVIEFMDPLNCDIKRGNFRELTCHSLKLGDRVRRGLHWRYGNQDHDQPGTVIGQINDGIIRVQWDCGNTYSYRYQEDNGTLDVKTVTDRRVLVDEMVAVGCRVVRGQDWKSHSDDGTPGNKGTVLEVRQDGQVVVRWDCRKIGLYKMGNRGLFEIKLADDSNNESVGTNNHNVYNTLRKDTDNSDDDTSNSKTNNLDYVIPIYSDSAVSAIWEYKDNIGTWKPYPPDINTRIEKAYQRKRAGKIIIQMDHSTFLIHFTQMVQEDPHTKNEIPVRRKD